MESRYIPRVPWLSLIILSNFDCIGLRRLLLVLRTGSSRFWRLLSGFWYPPVEILLYEIWSQSSLINSKSSSIPSSISSSVSSLQLVGSLLRPVYTRDQTCSFLVFSRILPWALAAESTPWYWARAIAVDWSLRLNIGAALLYSSTG
jgi:hypothetical protein